MFAASICCCEVAQVQTGTYSCMATAGGGRGALSQDVLPVPLCTLKMT